jgi:hypothetical protein
MPPLRSGSSVNAVKAFRQISRNAVKAFRQIVRRPVAWTEPAALELGITGFGARDLTRRSI